VFRCTNYVGAATKDITWSLSGAAQYKQTILGAQALGSGVSAGAVTLPVAATGQFTAGEWVLVYESDSLQEVALVSSLTTNTSLTVPAIQNAYTTDALVIPLFGAVTYQSGGTGTGNATVYALPDRIIAL
jgi:hypothetical protein